MLHASLCGGNACGSDSKLRAKHPENKRLGNQNDGSDAAHEIWPPFLCPLLTKHLRWTRTVVCIRWTSVAKWLGKPHNFYADLLTHSYGDASVSGERTGRQRRVSLVNFRARRRDCSRGSGLGYGRPTNIPTRIFLHLRRTSGTPTSRARACPGYRASVTARL